MKTFYEVLGGTNGIRERPGEERPGSYVVFRGPEGALWSETWRQLGRDAFRSRRAALEEYARRLLTLREELQATLARVDEELTHTTQELG